MTFRCVVFDFDGTLTDVERHAPDFHEASKEALAAVLGFGLPEVRRLWDEVDNEHRLGPVELGWVYDGRVVGPARGDPYLVANTVVRVILERYGFEDPGPTVFEVHKAAYMRVAPPFRQEAGRMLEAAVSLAANVFVVTNSHTDTVASRLDALALGCRSRIGVRGNARKFIVGPPSTADERFDALPEALSVQGLQRPILLHRGAYFDVLRSVWEASESGPETTLVIGDLFELDLAMPSALGCAVHLVTRPSTLEHERNAALQAVRGGAGELANIEFRV